MGSPGRESDKDDLDSDAKDEGNRNTAHIKGEHLREKLEETNLDSVTNIASFKKISDKARGQWESRPKAPKSLK